MEVETSEHGGVAILTVRGPMTGNQRKKIEEPWNAMVRSGARRFVLELVQAPFIDSACLEWIREAAQESMDLGIESRVVLGGEISKDIFKATRMRHWIHVCEDRESALRSLR